PGAPEMEHAYLAALAGEHSYLSGAGAQATACDAITSPVVTGHPDLSVVDTMIAIVLAYLDTTSSSTGDSDTSEDSTRDSDPAAGHGAPGITPGTSGQGTSGQGSATTRSKALSPEA